MLEDRRRTGFRDLSAAVLGISASLDVALVLRETRRRARALPGARYGVIATIDEAGQPQDFVTSGLTPDEQRQMIEWPYAMRLFEHLRELPGPLRAPDLQATCGSLASPRTSYCRTRACRRQILVERAQGRSVLALLMQVAEVRPCEDVTGAREVSDLSPFIVARSLRSSSICRRCRPGPGLDLGDHLAPRESRTIRESAGMRWRAGCSELGRYAARRPARKAGPAAGRCGWTENARDARCRRRSTKCQHVTRNDHPYEVLGHVTYMPVVIRCVRVCRSTPFHEKATRSPTRVPGPVVSNAMALAVGVTV